MVLSLTKRADDGSLKCLWTLGIGTQVESIAFDLPARKVLRQLGPLLSARLDDIPANHVICVSSQAGCNIGCTFCATGLQPSAYNLSTDEIVTQVRCTSMHYGCTETVTCAVTFAVMGEPLLNYQNVVTAGNHLLGSGIARSESVSTVGIVPRLSDLAKDAPDLFLFISLHATSDEQRQNLIPVATKYPLRTIISAGYDFAEATSRRVTANYLLLPGINDTTDDAIRLGRLLDATVFNVQILLWNEIEGLPYRRASLENALQFYRTISDVGLHSYITPSAGRLVRGACGQLATIPTCARSRH